ncbi:MAG: 2-hydroxyacyl-CoA dehydratase family protein [Spirochaetota bacterium]|nr:2-hydroxyacyl-CoA dehydratase family protein [Spirochaetota bacterium]
MFEEFYTVAQSINNEYIVKAKEQGVQCIGYTCSYFPEEILHSLGIIPYRVKGLNVSSLSVADAAFGPFICSHPKCLLQHFADGDYSFLDGIVVTPGCDSMRRIDECIRKTAVNLNLPVVPPFFFHYAVPHKITEYSVKWLVDELQRFIDSVTEHFSLSFSYEKLKESIAFYNRMRKRLEELNTLRMNYPARIAGADAVAVYVAGLSMPRDRFYSMVESLLSQYTGTNLEGRRRLMLIGSANDDIDFIKAIEGETAVVVADTLCYGPRLDVDYVDESDEPLHALALRYLNHSHCPRMYGGYKQRLAKVVEAIERAKVEGVVLQNIRFCDLHGAENGLIERDLEKMGIPCLRLEREYGPMADYERMRMRIDAFIERLEVRKFANISS